MMLRSKPQLIALAIASLFISACDQEVAEKKVYTLPTVEATQAEAPPATPGVEPASEPSSDDGSVELTWDDLVPVDWRPDTLMKQYNIDDMQDDDPRAKELAAKMKQLWDVAPVVRELEGKLIKLPGYVVPVEDDGKKVTEFLLVPYQGACIHVPPPPANQTVYVITGEADAKIRKVFDTVWVTGIVKLEKVERELATSGYTLLATKVEPYQ